MATEIFKNVQFPEKMDLRLAAVYANISEARLRTLLREGAIPAMRDESNRWVIERKALDAYLTQKAAQPRRTSGAVRGEGKAWVIRVKYQDLQKVKDFLSGLGIELQPRYNYDKMREYQAKRKAKAASPQPSKPTTTTK